MSNTTADGDSSHIMNGDATMTEASATAAAADRVLDVTAEKSLALGDSYHVDQNYAEAVDAYATALLVWRDAADGPLMRFRILSHRSSAFYELARYQEAWDDAKEAGKLLSSKTNGGNGGSGGGILGGTTAGASGDDSLRPREAEMCSRREGLSALALKRYSDAQIALESARQLALLNGCETNIYQEWIQRCKERAASAAAAAPAKKQAGPPQPPTASSTPPALKPTPTPAPSPATPATPVVRAPAAAGAPSSSSSSKRPAMPKYQYYQNDKFMTISVLEQNVQAQDLRVDFERKHLTVILTKRGVDFTVIAGTLYDEIDVDRCKVNIKDEKVLIKLRKAKEFEWHELFGKSEPRPKKAPPTTPAPAADAAAAAATATTEDATMTDAAPGTPDAAAAAGDATASAKKQLRPSPYASHKDWDKIEKDVKAEEANEKPVGDEAMNKLFQQIYSGADEDTRRAMIKSYQTSGGTVLSTNWKEVQEKDYEKERTAPKGMEWKTWEGKKLPMEDDD